MLLWCYTQTATTPVVLLHTAPTMISARDGFLELFLLEKKNTFLTQFTTHMSSLWKERFFSSKKKRTPTGLSVSNCELNQGVNCGWHYALTRVRPRKCTLVQMCPLYLALFSSRACTLWRGSWFMWVSLSLCSVSLCGMFLMNLSCQGPWTREFISCPPGSWHGHET